MRRTAWMAAALAALALLQLLAVLNPDRVEVDPEEMYNAAHAYALTRGHWLDAFLLQYRPFCGGCTLNAALGAGVFTVLPSAVSSTWLAWKVVPTLFLLVLAGASIATLGRREGRGPAVAMGLLLLLAPPAFADLALIAWGNHYESGVLALLSLLLVTGPLPRGRAVLLGLCLGMALWIGFSGLFALPAAALWLVLRPRQGARTPWGWALLGVLLGLSPWALQVASAGVSPFGEIYGQGEATPRLSHVPDQLLTLVHPRQLAGAWGAPQAPLPTGVAAAAALVVAGALALRRGPPLARAALLYGACWAGIYLFSGFSIPVPPPPEIPIPASLRYTAPLYPLALLLLAAVAGDAWQRGQRWGALLLAPALLAGLLGRIDALLPPFPAPAAAAMWAPDFARFRQQASYLLPLERHRACGSRDPRERAWHAYALGRAAATTALEGNPVPELGLRPLRAPRTVPAEPYYEGAAEAAMDALDPHSQASLLAARRIADATALWPPEGLRSALWSRRDAPARWLQVIERHDAAALAEVAAALSAEDPALREAAWRTVGRRWGEDTARWHLPDTLLLPTLPTNASVPDAFAAGLGEALGERWGPLAAAPLPEGLPAEWEPAFQAGYALGVRRRWAP